MIEICYDIQTHAIYRSEKKAVEKATKSLK